ncbi:MAG: hypothetical protein KF784_09745 [Fimbriimonadaceae bacterium]|nr:hypothetical protein [Fimbriimonadaceae bacterium]
MLSFLPALVFLALPGQDSFSTPMQVVETQRLALTPKIDGKLDVEEWDELARGSYMQWEPDRLYAACLVAEGDTAVVSYDFKNNGWLVGKDNLEIRVGIVEGKPVVKVRVLDASNPNAPTWTDDERYRLTVQVASQPTEGGWFVETSVEDPGDDSLPADNGKTIGVRVDTVAANTEGEALTPRIMTPVELTYNRGSNVPGGMKWNVQVITRTTSPASNYRIRVTFNGTNDLGLKMIGMRTEGFGRDEALTFEKPFPRFDNKGRAFVDYETTVPATSTEGYRLLRVIVTDQTGQSAVLKTSWEVAPVVEFDLVQPARRSVNNIDVVAKFSCYVKSNTQDRVEGRFHVYVPEGWDVQSGQDTDFFIANARGSSRRVFEVRIPKDTAGTFPFRLEAKVGSKVIRRLVWVTIG